jgi:hypothetical protein
MNIKPKYRLDIDETIYLDANTEFEGILIPPAEDIKAGKVFSVFLDFKKEDGQEYSVMFDPSELLEVVLDNHQNLLDCIYALNERDQEL